MKPERLKPLLELARQTDWPRLLQMGGTLMREMRGDGDGAIAADAERASSAGKKTIGVFEQIGRTAVGCRLPGECSCPFCEEKKGHG